MNPLDWFTKPWHAAVSGVSLVTAVLTYAHANAPKITDLVAQLTTDVHAAVVVVTSIVGIVSGLGSIIYKKVNGQAGN